MKPLRIAHFLGVLLQALILGTLLFWSIMRLIQLSGTDRLFRYEGF